MEKKKIRFVKWTCPGIDVLPKDFIAYSPLISGPRPLNPLRGPKRKKTTTFVNYRGDLKNFFSPPPKKPPPTPPPPPFPSPAP